MSTAGNLVSSKRFPDAAVWRRLMAGAWDGSAGFRRVGGAAGAWLRGQARVLAMKPLRLPPSVALVGLKTELGRYLCEWFAQYWPEARVSVRSGDQPVVADLVVVDDEPPASPLRPTLWLAEVDRSQSLIRLGPTLWRTAMPTTPARLKRLMLACLDSL